jgi:hypothetical protein
LSTTPNGKDQTANCTCSITDEPTEDAANLSLEDTCRTRPSRPASQPSGLERDVPDVPASVTSHSLLHPSINKTRSRSQ